MSKFNSRIPIPDHMNDCIKTTTGILAGVGIPGGLIGPGADWGPIIGLWGTMTINLASEAGHSLNIDTAKKIAFAVATGVGTFLAGAKVTSKVIGWLAAPFTGGLSLAIAVLSNAAMNGSFTWMYGRAVARYFLQTDKVDSVEVMIKILSALVGAELGVSTGYEYLID